LKDDIYEIGVHIADVGHFVDEGTILDDEARLRTTSIYLTHRFILIIIELYQCCQDYYVKIYAL